MAVLKEEDRKKLKDVFGTLREQVIIVMFTQEMECQFCATTRTLLEEVAILSDKLSLEVHDFVAEGDLAAQYGVDKIPATILRGDDDYGIRFYGVPSGYEFTTLIQDIIDVGKRSSGLDDQVKAEVARIDRPVHLQVIIAPT